MRPRLTAAMAKAVNYQVGVTADSPLCQRQQQVQTVVQHKLLNDQILGLARD